MSRVELYGTRGCPYTAELREDLEWRGVTYVEYDVEADVTARRRLAELAPGNPRIPILVDEGRIVSIGWQGRSCLVRIPEA